MGALLRLCRWVAPFRHQAEAVMFNMSCKEDNLPDGHSQIVKNEKLERTQAPKLPSSLAPGKLLHLSESPRPHPSQWVLLLMTALAILRRLNEQISVKRLLRF